LVAPVVGHEVVGVVVEDRVDLLEVDEVLDVDGAGPLGVERLELLRRDDHVAVLRELVALHDVVVGDLVAGVRVDARWEMRLPVSG
jgi:hypothetical protein